MINWILSKMFPPRMPQIRNRDAEGILASFNYLERIARKHLPENKEAAARLTGKAEEKRVICLPGRVV